jgi:hypothetical protein
MNGYRTRYIQQSDAVSLVNMYHLAKTALCTGSCGRWERMSWAAKQYHRENPQVSVTGAYKDLEGLLQ